ncbi:MAG: DNA cytosine methyltransferase [Candidatus Hatepunaea meridiana]|nr:DNA cytosine methyltransferase [Candidatus Hatepunaea meridiana]
MKRNKKTLKAIDFFCGAGGVSCGFRQAGIDVLGGIDIDKNCKTTYESNNDAKFLNIDIATCKKEILHAEFDITRNQDDLIFIGCSPCQYYSNIKTSKAKSAETRLLLEDFQEFIEYFQPGYVLVENVPGFEKKPESPINKFKNCLEKLNYTYDESIINAKHYGVPQNRRRYVLLASRVNETIKLPDPDKSPTKTVRNAIGDYKTFQPILAGDKDESTFLHSSASLSELNLRRINSTPKNGGDRRAWKDDPELQLECYKNHEGHYDVYGRMSWGKPSPALTTKFRYTSNGRYGHPEQDRAISIREGATLQSFPLDYNFYALSQTAIAKMIGNAVPPELAKRIGKTIIENKNGDI